MQRHFKLNVNGNDFDVVVEEVSSTYSPRTSAPAGAGDQCAQMGGVVASIAVKEGQSVAEGDRLVELEAMKMKVPVISSCAGKVSRIAVAVGDAVESGQVLVVIA